MAIATLTFPKAGTYLIVGDIRAFPRAANPGHSPFCSMPSVGPQVPPRLINTLVDATGGAQDEPFVGTFAASAGQSVDVLCHQGVGTGEITLTYDISALHVG